MRHMTDDIVTEILDSVYRPGKERTAEDQCWITTCDLWRTRLLVDHEILDLPTDSKGMWDFLENRLCSHHWDAWLKTNRALHAHCEKVPQVIIKQYDGGLFIKAEDAESLVPPTKEGLVALHRYIAAKALERPLKPRERIVLRDGNKMNCSVSNLETERDEPIDRQDLLDQFDSLVQVSKPIQDCDGFAEELRWRLANWTSEQLAEYLMLHHIMSVERSLKKPDPHPSPSKDQDAESGDHNGNKKEPKCTKRID